MKTDSILTLGELLKASTVRVGERWVQMNCPFAPELHTYGKDKRPSFGISINEEGPSSYHCFACGSKGTLFYLPIALKIVPTIDVEQVREFILKNECAFSIQKTGKKAGPKILEAIPETVLSAYVTPLYWGKINNSTIRKFEIAVSPKTQSVMMPIRDWLGRLVAIKYRFKDKSFKVVKADTIGPKRAGVWYGIHLVDPSKRIYLVEGERDAMLLTQIGCQAIASQGSDLTEAQIEFLNKFGGTYTAFFDNDNAGRKATKLACRKIKNCTPMIYPPTLQVKDPAEVVEKELDSHFFLDKHDDVVLYNDTLDGEATK